MSSATSVSFLQKVHCLFSAMLRDMPNMLQSADRSSLKS